MAARDVLVASPVTGTGGILAGPLGTTLPTDTTTEPAAGFVARGYVGEDGLTMTTNRTSEKIRAWGGDAVRVVQTEHDVTFAWSYLETTELTAADVFGEDNVTSAAGLTSIRLNSEPLPHKSWVFEMKDGDKRVRVVVPDGQITEIGDTQFVHTAATAHQVTLEAFPGEDGVKAFVYILDQDA